MMIEMERRELHGLVTNQVIPAGCPHFWRSEGERVSHIHAESLPTLTRSPSQPHFGPSHPDDAAKVAMVQQQVSFIFFYFLLNFLRLASTHKRSGEPAEHSLDEVICLARQAAPVALKCLVQIAARGQQ